MEEVLIKSGETQWISDVPEIKEVNDLPSRCFLNKVTTGCGGTSQALWSDKPYVLAMPRRKLIDNKMRWAKIELSKPEPKLKEMPIAVHSTSGYRYSDIPKHNKIMVTYDSLPKVVKALGDKVKDYKLLIDEFHMIVDEASWRERGSINVVELFDKFGDFVFMSATPDKREDLPKKLQSIPEVRIDWKYIPPINVDFTYMGRKELYSTVVYICEKYLWGTDESVKDKNAYIFINSVVAVVDILKALQTLKKDYPDDFEGLQLSDETVRIICSDNTDDYRDNLSYIHNNLGTEFSIGDASDEPRKLNFITSRDFSGVDYFDENGYTYIVSDGNKDHTKYNPATTITQIVGRIRDTNYRNNVTMFVSKSPYYSNITESEYRGYINNTLREADELVKTYYETDNSEIKRSFLEQAKNSSFYTVTSTNDIVVRELVKKSELSKYRHTHRPHFMLKREDGELVQREGINKIVFNHTDFYYRSILKEQVLPPRDTLVLYKKQKPSFEEMCTAYFERGYLYSILSPEEEARKKVIEVEYPIIPTALLVLGYEKIKALKFRIKDIKAELLNVEKISEPTKIIKMLESINLFRYRDGNKLTLKVIKKDIQRAYDLLGINRIAKAADIKNLYSVRECLITENGGRTKGFQIIAKK